MLKYTVLTLGFILCVAAVAGAQPNVTLDSPYQLRYATHLSSTDTPIRIVNDGAHNPSALCANIYGFATNTGQMTSCCSCKIAANAMVSLSVRGDMTFDLPTPSNANSVVIKILGSGTVQGACNAGSLPAAPVSGLLAWTEQTNPYTSTGADSPFLPGTLSAAELTSITGQCAILHPTSHTCSSCP